MKISNKGLFLFLLVSGIVWGVIYWLFLAGN
ncbi:hypothetical protein DET59_10175 [Rossellomorea aquimaris]|uniref:Uncharacterized protein n=1 Tax=Rossellomorea aquimaris TaxID=189382 RepID=A0A366F148_9BACI|nr:hypothetical protein DET59_10175 [Rossellomorea aquimaris]